MAPSVTRHDFGRLPDGETAELFVLDNGKGLTVSVTDYGGIITSVRTPDRSGAVGEITLAHDTLEEYLAGHPYYGALVGRVCNRISGGGFTIDGSRYDIASNSGSLHLHGGVRGFDKYRYETRTETDGDGALLHLERTSPDGEEGYPGALQVRHTIGVTEDMRLIMEFVATTDAPTVVNLTNHTYWNLAGRGTIMDHELRLAVDAVAEVTGGVPSGRLVPVAGGPFDFSTWKSVERDLDAVIAGGANGYDHSLRIVGWQPGEPKLREAARVRSHASGREMVVSTTYPDVHFYSGNNLPGRLGRRGESLSGHEALCLECQFFPDSPNRPEFPPIILRPGRTYRHRTEHLFSTF